MQQRNWWEDDPVVGQAQPSIRQVVPPRPRQPSPQTPVQAQGDVLENDIRRTRIDNAPLDRRATELTIAEREQAATRNGLTPQLYADFVARRERLPEFERRLNNIEALFRRDFAGDRGGVFGMGGSRNIGGSLHSWLRPENQTFQSEADALIGSIAAMQGTTGGEMNSLAELRARFGPMVPAADDNDETIQRKLANLRATVAAQRAEIAAVLGEGPPPASQASEFESGMDAVVRGAIDTVQPRPGGSPPPQRDGIHPAMIELQTFANSGVVPPSAEQIIARAQGLGIPVNDEFRAEVMRGVRIRDSQGTPISVLQIPNRSGNQGAPPPAEEPSFGRSLRLGVGGAVQGLANIPGLISNPLNAGINAVFGTNLGTDLGASTREVLGLPFPQNDSEHLADAISQGGIGALGFGGGARAIAPYAQGAIRSALSRFAATPGVDTVTGATAGAGGEIARQSGAGPVGQIAATIGGGAAGAMGATRVARRFSPPQIPQSPLLTAGREERIAIPRALADPSVEPRLIGSAGTVIGSRILNQGLGRVGGQIERRVERLGRGGTALDESNAGQMVQGAVQRYIRDSGRQAARIYDAAETASEGVRVPPQQSIQRIDELLGRLGETPETNGAEIAFLQRLRTDLSNDLSVGALRDVRTSLRQRISNGGLTFGQNEASVLSIMEAASQDIEQGLRAAGRGQAATLFRRADDMYRDRMQFIEGTVQRLIGRRNANLPPERIFQNFRSMASPRGNNAGLARMMREMEPEEQADTAATFASALGRNNRGEFSTAHLVTQAAKLPRAARVNVFGPEGARSLDNLVTLAREHSRATKAIGGSPTGLRNDFRGQLTNLLFSGGLGLATQSSTTALVAGGSALAVKGTRDFLSARALMSTDLTRWARTAPRTTSPQVALRHVERLGTIAARNPAIAMEIQQLQQTLLNAINNNAPSATRAVASDGREEYDQRR